MEPIICREIIIIKMYSNSKLIFMDIFFALSVWASVRFSILHFYILFQVSDVLYHGVDSFLQ